MGVFIRLWVVCICCSLWGQTPSVSLKRAFPDISPLRIGAHVTALGADEMQGRGTGTLGEHRAAAYLVSQMEAAGLEPMGEGGSWFQQMPLHGSKPTGRCKLSLFGGGDPIELKLKEDYLLFNMGPNTLIPYPVRLIFVGYGISAPEYDYNDYQNMDVRGAVVVYFSGEPTSDDPHYFKGHRLTEHALPEMKQRVAAARGARGTLMIPVPRQSSDASWAYWQQTFAFEHVTLPTNLSGFFSGLLNPDSASLFFHKTRYDFEQLKAMERRGNLVSFALKQALSFRGHFQDRQFMGANVIGGIRGSDPLVADQYLLISAHYDHLGVGPAIDGDAIYNGVGDNALGCAGALELARHLAKQKGTLRRSVLFVFVTGEEKALLGSRYYCDNPVVPLSRTIGNINLDGLAMIDTFREVIGVGAELSTLGTHLASVCNQYGMHVSKVPPGFSADHVFDRSDQMSFAQAGIPAMLISEGFSYENLEQEAGLQRYIEWGTTRYHTPFDDLNQPINYDATVQHVRLVAALVTQLLTQNEVPQWVVEGRYKEARLKSLARKQ